MSSPHMSFRLNYYQLAKALRILVTLEPNQPIASLSQAAKMIIIDWISKHSINSSLNTSHADIEAIKLISEIPADQIDPYTTIQTIMAQAKAQSPPNQQAQQQIQKSAQQIQLELEDERLFAELKRESLEKQTQQDQEDLAIDEQIKLAAQIANRLSKSSTFIDPNNTESDISSVTDFSPPKDWIE